MRRSAYLNLVNITLLLTYVLILLGVSTRVFDAGMSCPDWPHCYGLWWPWPEARVSALNGVGYVVDQTHYAWWQVFLEWSHRGVAAIVGACVLGLVALTILLRGNARVTRRVWQPLGLLLALLVLQIKLGAITVWMANIHWTVAMHLGAAMLIFGCLVWMRRMVAVRHAQATTGVVPVPLAAGTPFRALAIGFAVLVWLTMIVGGMVSSAHAGGVCGGLFSCDGSWHPEDPFQKWHMLHRLLALLVFAVSIALMILAKRAPVADDAQRGVLRKVALHLHYMVLGQVALGVLTLYSFFSWPQFYEVLSIGHLAWGTLLFMASLGALLTLRYGTAGRFHD